MSSLLPPDLSLAERIYAAERAVQQRDERVRLHAGVFAARLQAQARRSGRVFAVGAIAPFLLGWFMARSAPRSKKRRDDPQRGRRHLSDAPWATMVPLLWPLMPEHLRNRLSPGLASFLTGIGLPLVASQLSKRAERAAEREAVEREAEQRREDAEADADDRADADRDGRRRPGKRS